MLPVEERVKLDAAELPQTPGCYVLLLRVGESRTVAVGALGEQAFSSGFYAYCGSAQGPGGLRARVGRHLRGAGVRRWHVDELRDVGAVEAVWVYPGALRAWECAVAAALAALPDARRAVPGFGSSDCGCAGHLIALPGPPDGRLWLHDEPACCVSVGATLRRCSGLS